MSDPTQNAAAEADVVPADAVFRATDAPPLVDAPAPDHEKELADAKAKCGDTILHVPVTLGTS